MRDTLDLKKLAKEANSLRLWARFANLVGVLVIIFIVLTVFTSGSPAQMYARIDNKWQSPKDKAGGVCSVQTSPAGITWLLTRNPLALSRWIGNDWEWYTPVENEQTTNLCRMTLDQETIWVLFDRGIARFDGRRWEIYTNVTPAKPVSIAANSLGVYVLDSRGNLARFDGNQWSVTNVQTILPKLSSNIPDTFPLVLATSDDTLFMRWMGVWRFDGHNWQEITIGGMDLKYVTLIGTAHHRLWTKWSNGLIDTVSASDFDGGNWKSFAPSDLGLSHNEQVYQVTEYGNDTLFATDRGLIRFDGSSWTPFSIFDNQLIGVAQVSVHPNGNIWTITANSGSVFAIVVGFVCLTFALVLFFIIIIVNSSRNTTRLRAARSLIEPYILPVSESQEIQNSNWLLVAVIVLFLLVLVLTFLGQSNLVDILGPLTVVLYSVWAVRRILRNLGSGQKLSAKAMPVILFVGWIGILWFGIQWLGTFNETLVAPFFVVWSAIGFIPSVTSFVRYLRRYTGDNAYQNASDDNAKINTSGARKTSVQLIQAATALQAGKLDEAETLARATAAQSQYMSSAILSGSLNVLGLTLMYQKHYEEAIRYIEIAIRINPISLSTLTSLAEVYLEEDTETQRALEVIQFARQYGFENWIIRVMKKSSRPTTEGVYGWALARLGRFKEADNQIQKALKRIPAKNKAGVAYLQYIKGRIEALKGNSTQAAEWYQRASQNDKGLYGQLAETALKEVQSTS